MFKTIFISALFFFSIQCITAQITDLELGSEKSLSYQRGGYFDYSDPEALNMKVSVWGFVKYPGRYMVPDYTTVSELLSYAGGPTEDSVLDDLRIYRNTEDGKPLLIKFSYNDVMWESELSGNSHFVPDLHVNDILVVPGTDRLYFRDYFSIGISIFSALVSLITLIYVIK